MIIGIGTDLIEIERVTLACEKEDFIKKYFTERERDLFQMDKRKAADNFAVKEAISKMFGTGFRTFMPIDIEVLRDNLGKPYVNLYQEALDIAKSKNINKIHVTITNTKKYAQAFVIGEGD